MKGINAREIRKLQKYIGNLPGVIDKASARAVNRTADKARTQAKGIITNRYNLKSSYVNSKLKVVQRATTANPEAIIEGRSRATRLARYMVSPPGVRPIRVRVLRGASGTRTLTSAFLLPLKRGKDAMQTTSSGGAVYGILVRVSPDKVKHLYGPSVQQAFKWVVDAGSLDEKIEENLTHEFNRQMDMLLRYR